LEREQAVPIPDGRRIQRRRMETYKKGSYPGVTSVMPSDAAAIAGFSRCALLPAPKGESLKQPWWSEEFHLSADSAHEPATELKAFSMTPAIKTRKRE
jgi:hypothetical protein